MLSESDFERRRGVAQAIGPWRDHRDFVEERDAHFFSYGTAGVSACFQTVPLAAFERWGRLTGASANLSELDRFAAHWRWRSRRPNARVRGRPAAAQPGAPPPSPQDETQIIDIFGGGYLRWREALTRLELFPNAATIDAYASFVVETCLISAS